MKIFAKLFGKAEDDNLKAEIVIEPVDTKLYFSKAVEEAEERLVREAITEALQRFVFGNEAYEQTLAANQNVDGLSKEELQVKFPQAVWLYDYPASRFSTEVSQGLLVGKLTELALEQKDQ